MPPSEATIQYPPPSGVAAIPTIGRVSARPSADPEKAASPKELMPPLLPAIQYPWPSGVRAMPTAGLSRVVAVVNQSDLSPSPAAKASPVNETFWLDPTSVIAVTLPPHSPN